MQTQTVKFSAKTQLHLPTSSYPSKNIKGTFKLIIF